MTPRESMNRARRARGGQPKSGLAETRRLGGLVHPVLAAGVFTLVVGYYARTSQGLRSAR